jgi:hypothetical protein
MNRLLRKGAVGGYADELDQLAAADMAAHGGNQQAILGPPEVTRAEEWSNRAFAKYFKNSPTLKAAPVLCGRSDSAQSG